MGHPPHQTLLLDRGWLFHLGDLSSPVTNTHLAAYMANKAGYARGAAKPSFDDSDWRELDLPHDWAVELPVTPDAHLSGGFHRRGVAWYRRHLRLEDADRGRRLTLRFDGVATHCIVWVNGHLLHRNWCGYTGFTVDFTDVASFGDELNVIAVRVDATYMEGWWYEGAGIYRHVWLIKTHPVHLRDVFARPVLQEDGSWVVEVDADASGDCTVEHELLTPDGSHAGRCATGSGRTATGVMQVPHPQLWSLEAPTLYTLISRALVDGAVVDESTTPLGFRTIRFDPNDGFFLNDQRVQLNGTCNHQDHAGVGVAVPDSIWDFRIRRLKEMGCNAYRCAHHPPAPELLDACDRLGMLVMDENRNFGSSPEHLAQLEAMVKRDRNHPSVILWSICNEEALQGTAAGAAIARTMAAKVRELDWMRPVTASVSGGLLGEHCIADAVDVIGINYQLPIYDDVHRKYAGRAIVAGETHCVCATRGEYREAPDKHRLPADDSYAAPWGATARATWRALRDKRYVGGIFVWTGFDYRGEPTPHTWPCVNSFFGLLDTCGFPKDGFYLHKAWWTAEPFVHLLPHWNAPAERVTAYSNCDEVELWLNGRSLGRRAVDPIEMASWPVAYEPGELRAVGFREGNQVAETVIATTGPAVALGLEAAGDLPADGEHALPVTVFALDAAGRRVPDASHYAGFTVAGPARVLGVGNGDPTCHEPDKALGRSLFNGLAQVIVQSTGEPGEVTLTATADGIAPAVLRLQATPAPHRPHVPVPVRRWLVTDWRVSPRTAEQPDVATAGGAAADMNSWERLKLTAAHTAIPAGESGYVVYHAKLRLPRLLQVRGAALRVPAVEGQAELFLDGRAHARLAGGDIALPPLGDAGASLAIRLRAGANGAGLSGPVELIAG